MALSHDPLWPRAGGWPALGATETADAVIVGVPTWRTSLSPTQAHTTPAAIRGALARYSATLLGPPPIDLTTELRIRDAGDIAAPDGQESAAIERLAALSARTRMLIALGGDNALTYPVAQGVQASGLITLDAHFDLRDGVSNGSPVRRLIADAAHPIDPRRIVQIGIADFANSAAYAQRAADYGIRVITLDEYRRRPAADVIAEAVAVAGAGAGGIHLDIDVDVVDRAAAPGCPASLPGGLTAAELRHLVRGIAGDYRVMSADIAEVDAAVDAPDQRTVRLAALCVLELLAGLAGRAR